MILGVKGMEAITGHNHITALVDKLNTLDVAAKEFDYAKFTVKHTYMLDKIFGTCKKLYQAVSDGDSIVCHSFGGVLTIDLLIEMAKRKSTKKLKNIYMFNPAADRDIVIPTEHVEKIYIFVQPKDRLLGLAPWLPFNVMGDLGKYGYQHPNPKIVNMELIPMKESSMHHDDAMHEPQLTTVCEFIKSHLEG